VLQHQERYDGHGYPQGLKAKQIVIGARVFAIADTMDAITSDRPYRKGRAQSVANEEIKRCSGSQFDPDLVEAFVQIPETDWIESAEPWRGWRRIRSRSSARRHLVRRLAQSAIGFRKPAWPSWPPANTEGRKRCAAGPDLAVGPCAKVFAFGRSGLR